MNKNLFKRICVCLTSIVFLTSICQIGYAQSIKRQSISSYGSSSVLSENILISQTAGQSFSTSMVSNSSTVSQGFQQPNTFSVEEVIVPSAPILDITVFPNPASSSITLLSKELLQSSFIRVTDMNGKSLFSEKVLNMTQHAINCSTWVNGAYMITISDRNQKSKTIKLIISK